MDGLALVRSLEQKGYKVPIILVTGAADKKMALEALGLGVFSILEKPCTFVELDSVAEKAISQSRALDLTHKILNEFQSFIRYVNEWSETSFDHIVQLENKVYNNNIVNKSPQEAAQDMRIRRQMRQTEKTVRHAQTLIDSMFKDFHNLRIIDTL